MATNRHPRHELLARFFMTAAFHAGLILLGQALVFAMLLQTLPSEPYDLTVFREDLIPYYLLLAIGAGIITSAISLGSQLRSKSGTKR